MVCQIDVWPIRLNGRPCESYLAKFQGTPYPRTLAVHGPVSVLHFRTVRLPLQRDGGAGPPRRRGVWRASASRMTNICVRCPWRQAKCLKKPALFQGASNSSGSLMHGIDVPATCCWLLGPREGPGCTRVTHPTILSGSLDILDSRVPPPPGRAGRPPNRPNRTGIGLPQARGNGRSICLSRHFRACFFNDMLGGRMFRVGSCRFASG